MAETTTIEVRTDQRDRLQDMAMGSYKAALDELIESYDSSQDVDLDPVINRIDDLENELPRKIAQELQR